MIDPWLCQVSLLHPSKHSNLLAQHLLYSRFAVLQSVSSGISLPPATHPTRVPFLAPSGRFRLLSKLPKMYSECLWVRTLARASSPSTGASGAGQAPSNRTHSILRARAHPSAVRIGRPEPPRRASAPERPGSLPIPTGCQNKSSLPVTGERSGGRRRRTSWGRRAAVGGQVAGGRSAVAAPAAHVPAPRLLAPALTAFCLHRAGARLASPVPPAAFRLLLPPAHIFSPPPPPVRAGPLTSWTTARGRLCRSDVSFLQSCGCHCSGRGALKQSLAGFPSGA